MKRDKDALTGTLREAEEETGHRRSPGPRLPTTHHFVNGRAEQVSYWAELPGRRGDRRPLHARPRGGPDPLAEPSAARARLTRPRDRDLIDEFLATLRHARPSATPDPQAPPAVCPCASVRARLRARRAGPRQPQLHLATQNWPCSTVVVRCCCGGIGSS
ncbi:NUDIX hydrolase [Streptomyces europaeiscabiei]|uniref:NUDIX hydrolase n=1 Tax=Streptomyces europaeiscabiei TaxID=146819 RepID=UPI0029CA7DF1|nr:NUDIX hydrolase [Streptomyces europaeiscabiei]